MAFLGTCGCAGSDGAQTGVTQAGLTSSCEGPPLLVTRHTFENIGQTAIIQTCASEDGTPRFVVTNESTGLALDYSDLERQDAFAFHNSGASMRVGVRAALEAAPDLDRDVHIWFRILQSAGNGGASCSADGALRNGLSIGGGIETGGSDRNAVNQNMNSCKLNPNGASGFEIPHLAGISEHVDTVGEALGVVVESGGNSISTPMVAGVVAALHELNPSIKSWPEVMVPGLMASADEDLDGTVLNLHDGIDDWDGAGLVNAWLALEVLGSGAKRDGGNAAATRGHDYGSMAEATTPTYTTYSETYNASVTAGKALRVTALLQSRPACPANPGCSGGAGCTSAQVCSANPFVVFSLQVYDGAVLMAASNNTSTNYQFVRVVNSSGGTKTYNIRLIPLNYSGIPSTTWGLAWAAADE